MTSTSNSHNRQAGEGNATEARKKQSENDSPASRRRSSSILQHSQGSHGSRTHFSTRNRGLISYNDADEGEGGSSSRNTLVQSSKSRPMYENSYRIFPEPSTRFRLGQAQHIVDKLVAQQLEDSAFTRYDPDKAKRVCLQLSNSVKRVLRQSINIPRYKIVVFAVIGQNLGQDFSFTSRCIWLPETDSFVESMLKVDDAFVVCTVFGIYYE